MAVTELALTERKAFVKKPQRQKRSRSGCFSCKKLKIKCNEAKPTCEYCEHTGRICEYPVVIIRPKSPNEEIIEVCKTIVKAQELLNANWHNMGISKFEYRLLHFFESFCVPLFSFNVNMEVDKVWRYEVPKLWQRSNLVRQSVFLFAALNLWPLCTSDASADLLKLKPDDLYKFLDYENSNETLKRLVGDTSLGFGEGLLGASDNLFTQTTNYFMNSLSETSEILNRAESFLIGDIENQVQCLDIQKHADGLAAKHPPLISNIPHQTTAVDVDNIVNKSAELVVSGILIFSFLGLHPHQLVPLVYFLDEENDDEGSRADLLGICSGIHSTIVQSSVLLVKSSFKGLFVSAEERTVVPDDFPMPPVIRKLKAKLDEYILLSGYDEVFDTESSEECEALRRSLRVLEVCLYRTIYQNYPIPLFRWLIATEKTFGEMARTKNVFALKLMYYFSCLCTICRFLLFKYSSIWMDFIMWYKEYNYKTYGGWMDQDDANLYHLVVLKSYEVNEFHFLVLSRLDPDNVADILT